MPSLPTVPRYLLTTFLTAVLLVLGAADAWAHCDTMDGPVVTDAQEALSSEDLTPVLKWIQAEDEPAVKDAFEQTLVVRQQSPEARELADRYFFETVVRLHRESEGAPYTGLKPAGTNANPAISAADQALKQGSADALIEQITGAVAEELQRGFAHAHEAKEHADASVEEGRAFVEAYVHFIHLVERIHNAATDHTSGHDAATAEH